MLEPLTGDLASCLNSGLVKHAPALPDDAPARTLAELPLGARLVLRCRKDWRAATVAVIELEQVTLAVCSPTGHTYRVRRPAAAPLDFDGHIPLLGGDAKHTHWRVGFARYDLRW